MLVWWPPHQKAKKLVVFLPSSFQYQGELSGCKAEPHDVPACTDKFWILLLSFLNMHDHTQTRLLNLATRCFNQTSIACMELKVVLVALFTLWNVATTHVVTSASKSNSSVFLLSMGTSSWWVPCNWFPSFWVFLDFVSSGVQWSAQVHTFIKRWSLSLVYSRFILLPFWKNVKNFCTHRKCDYAFETCCAFTQYAIIILQENSKLDLALPTDYYPEQCLAVCAKQLDSILSCCAQQMSDLIKAGTCWPTTALSHGRKENFSREWQFATQDWWICVYSL